MRILCHLRREAASYDFTTLLVQGLGDPSTEKSLLSELRWRGVDGVVMVAPRSAPEDLEVESTVHQPIVTIGMATPTEPRTAFARIEIDQVAGGRLAAEHLLSAGRRRIAYLAGRVPIGERSGSADRVSCRTRGGQYRTG